MVLQLSLSTSTMPPSLDFLKGGRRTDARPPPNPHNKLDTFTNRVEGGDINVTVRILRHSVTGILSNRKQLGGILIGLMDLICTLATV